MGAQEEANFFAKCYLINILGSVGQMVSVTIIQLCCCSLEAAIIWMWLCSNKTLFTNTG